MELWSIECEGLHDKARDTDSDYVMGKTSRCWLGAVPRYWNVVSSCFHFIRFAENTSAALAPRGSISQPILLLFFFGFLLLNLSTIVASDFFYSVLKFIGVQRKTGLTLKKAIFERFQIFNQLPVRILNF